MFCQKCGKENEKNANFCGYCGTKFVKKIKPIKKINIPKEKKIMSKKTKVIIGVILLILILIITFLIYGFTKYSMVNIAKGYFVASVEKDSDDLYRYLNVENKEFTSKRIFEEVYDDEDDVDIQNYSVVSENLSDDGLSGTVVINYTLEDSSRTYTEKINLIKNKKNKFLIFDNWQISDESSIVVENNIIKVPKNAKVRLEGTKLNKKYLKKEKGDYDIYEIPQMFKGSYDALVTLESGMELNGEIKVTTIGTTNLKDLEIGNEDVLKKDLASIVNFLYENAIKNKSFDDIKKEFEYKDAKLNDLKESYNTFKNNLSDSLKEFNVEEIDIESTEITSEGYLEITADVDYKYTAEYNFFGDRETKNKEDNDLMNFTFDYYKNEFKLIDMSSMTTYFSKY